MGTGDQGRQKGPRKDYSTARKVLGVVLLVAGSVELLIWFAISMGVIGLYLLFMFFITMLVLEHPMYGPEEWGPLLIIVGGLSLLVLSHLIPYPIMIAKVFSGYKGFRGEDLKFTLVGGYAASVASLPIVAYLGLFGLSTLYFGVGVFLIMAAGLQFLIFAASLGSTIGLTICRDTFEDKEGPPFSFK